MDIEHDPGTAVRDDPHTSILYPSHSVIVTSSKLLAERINDLALMFGARAAHVCEVGSIETISAYDAPRSENQDRALITLDRF